MRQNKHIARLQLITQIHPDLTPVEQAAAFLEGGGKWVQLRMKAQDHHEVEATAHQLLQLCRAYNARLIINDHVDIANEVGADGVHLGKNDMWPSKARQILGEDKIIGGTANTLDDMLWVTNQGVDYIGLGPYKFTQTKEALSPVIGQCHMIDLTEAYSLKVKIPLPVIGVGGITLEDVPDVLSTGVYGIAASGGIVNSKDIRQATQLWLSEIKKSLVKDGVQ